mmetsp:Transcript_14417/g.25932  ORF Transcript_14417/g.25932 Transcript_14417/m.25932 type:complete len:80 (-) Transcript_14417:1530-1769(-)
MNACIYIILFYLRLASTPTTSRKRDAKQRLNVIHGHGNPNSEKIACTHQHEQISIYVWIPLYLRQQPIHHMRSKNPNAA